MNILHMQCCKSCSKIEFYSNIYTGDYILIRDGYRFDIDESNVDYPLIDTDIWDVIIKELDHLKYLRQS